MGCDEMSAPAANCVMAIGEALAWQCVKPTAVRSAGDATTTTNCTYSACGAGGRHAATRARRHVGRCNCENPPCTMYTSKTTGVGPSTLLVLEGAITLNM